MATTSDTREDTMVQAEGGLGKTELLASPASTPPSSGSGGSGAGWIVGLVALLLVGGGVGGAAYYASTGDEKGDKNELYEVAKRDLLVSVTEDGNLESASNVDIKCRVEGGSTILKIVEDGSLVKEGDVLVELDSSQLEEQITQQRIAVNKAQASMVQAEKDLQVAEISKQEYLEGTFRQDVQNADAQITIAMENLRTAENTLEHVKRMFRKGYVSKLQRESQEFAVKTAKLELESAKIAKEVLVKYTKAKMLEDLQAKIDAAKTRAASEKEAYELERSKLKRLEEQLANCIIKAPQSGMVVYANEQRGRFGSSQGPSIEEGATVRERQTILRLPDLSKMQVKVNVHESKVDKLEVGMRAIITIQGRQFPGEVDSIASQPEASSWWQGNIKEYATIVKIEGSPKDLKPGMTASVQIQVKYLKDVKAIPVSCVVEIGGKYYCWVKKDGEVEKRQLRLGDTNEKFVQVIDGVETGELVIRNPFSVISEEELAEQKRQDEEKDEKSAGKFGKRTRKGPKGGPAAAPSKKGGPAGGGRQKGGRRSMDLSRFDKDGDGAISKEEAPSFMKSFFDRLDTNKDGKIDKSEQQAMRRRSGGSRNLMQYDKNKDGKISKDEAPSFMNSFFDRLDSNSDGFIDKKELEAMRSRMKR